MFKFIVVSLLSCVQLFCNPINCSSPGSSVHGITQARILEWADISFSRRSSAPRGQTCVSCIGRWILHRWATSGCYVASIVSDSFVTPWTAARQTPLSMGFSRQEYRSGLPFPPLGSSPPRDGNHLLSLLRWRAGSLPQVSPEKRTSIFKCLHINAYVSSFTRAPHWKQLINLWHVNTMEYGVSWVSSADPTDCSMPGPPVHHQNPDFTQTHVHWVGDAIQPSHPLLFLSPPALNLSQCQGLFKWVSSLHQVAKVLELQLQHQFYQWTIRTDFI